VAAGFHTMNFFGLEIAMIGYQGTVFPVLLAVWFMSIVEKQLRRVIPDAGSDPDAVPDGDHFRFYRPADYRPGWSRAWRRYFVCP
jgi:hypothetical protein